MDQFAQIAANGIGGRMEFLEEPPLRVNDKKICRLAQTTQAPKAVTPKMATAEELSEALSHMREQYAPYLRTLSPQMASSRQRFDITSFVCNGESVSIPEYGGPMGAVKKTYVTELTLPQLDESECAFIHFEGADYRTVVSINGTFAGEHEGFFSPFEFDITELVKTGSNRVQVELYNDHIYMGSLKTDGPEYQGDKLYAATGLGWDDPKYGWHHCPPGMGIYNSVYIEIRDRVHISDLYVRPMDGAAELWVEVENHDYPAAQVEMDFSVYGLNFEETVFEHRHYIPRTVLTVGMCDSLTEAVYGDAVGQGIPMEALHGKNIFKIPFDMPNAKVWDLSTPYLYEVQISLLVNGRKTDSQSKHFGMRSFVQDIEAETKGMFYLNGRPIRLRGANTMGFEQQDVLRGDIEQLIDDILLAKLCNMNYFRLTQRPVQSTVYDFCDRLGLMTQTDLPLFGNMRRNKVAEGIRQAEEMERLIRSHPCNVVISYINEPFPNANNKPHRHLTRDELESFFTCCDLVVKMQNPDRVIKHVDGDYDPPTESMPDNHCYPMWYNGHGIDIGRLYRGYWMPVLPNWYYGCGEFGAEGLECAEVMREFYPKEWLTEPFDPHNIIRAQTGDFHYFFYDTPEGLDEWIAKSQQHQAFATSIMTESFRRDERMISFALHLFIDAWPSGWMKTIMDCKRNPKPAFFAYRNALEPRLLSLRTDRFTYYKGETVSVEAYLCNDTAKGGSYSVVFELYGADGKLIQSGTAQADCKACGVTYMANAEFEAATGSDREKLMLKAILIDETGHAVTYAEQFITVFEDCEVPQNDNVVLIEKLPIGKHEIAGETVEVKECGMLPLHFASRKTGHPAVAEFEEKDFAYWYDAAEDMITPVLHTTFTAEGFTPILVSGNKNEKGEWKPALAAAEKLYEGKRYVICQLDLRCENPVAKHFLRNLYTM